MKGCLRVDLGPDASGRTVITRRAVAMPMHLSRPYWDGRYLILQAVNATAGIFGADSVDVFVRAARGSSAVLTSPGATRLYRSRPGQEGSRLEQRCQIEAGAWLEVCPEILIAQGGACCRQFSRYDLEEGGAFLLIESLAPGRVASGEVFQFDLLEWTFELAIGGVVQARERCALRPGDRSLDVLRRLYPHSYYAACHFVFPGLGAGRELRAAIGRLDHSTCRVAASLPARDYAIIKLLAADSLELRRGIASIRQLCYSAAGRPLPLWRKL